MARSGEIRRLPGWHISGDRDDVPLPGAIDLDRTVVERTTLRSRAVPGVGDIADTEPARRLGLIPGGMS